MSNGRGELGLGATVVLLIIGLAIGCGIQQTKASNCRDAGWEYHWYTEQCLPKGK